MLQISADHCDSWWKLFQKPFQRTAVSEISVDIKTGDVQQKVRYFGSGMIHRLYAAGLEYVGSVAARFGMSGRIYKHRIQKHHSFGTEYVSASGYVLDFFGVFVIMKTRGEYNAEIRFYS